MYSIVDEVPFAGVELLRPIVGSGFRKILGTAFLVERELVCALTFVLCDRLESPQYVTLSSTRFETDHDALDWARFEIRTAESLEVALDGSGRFYHDVSQIVIHEDAVVRRIAIMAAHVSGSIEAVTYDAYIVFELSNGRSVSFGHAPRTFEGVCVSFGKPETLANPTDVRQRIVISCP